MESVYNNIVTRLKSSLLLWSGRNIIVSFARTLHRCKTVEAFVVCGWLPWVQSGRCRRSQEQVSDSGDAGPFPGKHFMLSCFHTGSVFIKIHMQNFLIIIKRKRCHCASEQVFGCQKFSGSILRKTPILEERDDAVKRMRRLDVPVRHREKKRTERLTFGPYRILKVRRYRFNSKTALESEQNAKTFSSWLMAPNANAVKLSKYSYEVGLCMKKLCNNHELHTTSKTCTKHKV